MAVKEVYFHKYCPKCYYSDSSQTSEPCVECLGIGSNEDSRKPVYFKEDPLRRYEDEEELEALQNSLKKKPNLRDK